MGKCLKKDRNFHPKNCFFVNLILYINHIGNFALRGCCRAPNGAELTHGIVLLYKLFQCSSYAGPNRTTVGSTLPVCSIIFQPTKIKCRQWKIISRQNHSPLGEHSRCRLLARDTNRLTLNPILFLGTLNSNDSKKTCDENQTTLRSTERPLCWRSTSHRTSLWL